ncbi:chitosanase [Xylariales sp. PMI_506]|nr:chitosanase [Xylariales sp. PMI_506]
MHFNSIFMGATLLTGEAAAKAVPANIAAFYNSVKAQGDCNNKLASGLYSYLDGPPDWSYCGDHLSDYGIIYIQGEHGLFANMDIDCDGISREPNNGRCGHNPSDQDVTAMRDTLESYDIPGVTDLDTYVHAYIVFGNSGEQPGNVDFDPHLYGVEDLSIVFVVTPTELICGIWGDTNGGERNASFVGEASLAMGELAFGNSVNGTVSHNRNDVLYIAFTGPGAVPGKGGADWAATTKEDFAASIAEQCRALEARIGATGAGGPPGTGQTCLWPNHCAGT